MKDAEVLMPINKQDLIKLYYRKIILPFNNETCAACSKIPFFQKWLKPSKSRQLAIFATAKREKTFNHWDPVFIGTRRDPIFDERLYWGQADRTSQAYAMCILQYQFHILNTPFMVRNPSRVFQVENNQTGRDDKLFQNVVAQVHAEYGTREECEM
jgi:N-acetyllactosaminide beta-1,3-N-acetylglucosaminyltransferase